MLALAFFASIFSTLMWLIYMFLHLRDKLGGVSFSSLGLLDLSLYIALLILPIFSLWMIFGYINQYLNFRRMNDNMLSLFKQIKKSHDYSDLLARVMLETEQGLKDSFVLNKFDLFIADMNELLAEIIQRGALSSPEQIDRLWTKVCNGGKWAFGKVIIEVSANQGNFGNRLVNRAASDTVLAGTILEFCARYQNLLNVLEKHDREHIFLSIIETGVYGKVYSILAPLASQVRYSRENDSTQRGASSADVEVRSAGLSAVREKEEPFVSKYKRINEEERKSFINVFNPFKKRQEESVREEPRASMEEKDPFSAALERSFGSADEDSSTPLSAYADEEPDISFSVEQDDEITSYVKEPVLQEISEPEDIKMPSSHTEEDLGFTHTRQALNNLKKEWHELKGIRQENENGRAEPVFERTTDFTPQKKIVNGDTYAPQTKDEDYAYPFGGWTDVDNYHK